MVTPTNPSSGSSGNLPSLPPNQKYIPQYKIDVNQWRGMWQKLFPNTQLTDLEVQQMTDQFIKNISDNMNHVLQKALEKQKELDRQMKEDQGG